MDKDESLSNGGWESIYIGQTTMTTEDTDAMLNCLASPYISGSGLKTLDFYKFSGAETALNSSVLKSLLAKTANIQDFTVENMQDTESDAKQSLITFINDVISQRTTIKNITVGKNSPSAA